MPKKFILFLTAWLALFIVLGMHVPQSCHAREKLIAVTEVWPPFRINAPDSTRGLTGIDIDIIDRLAEELDLEIEVQRHPFAMALEMIKNGSADITTGVAYSDKRATFILYVPTAYGTVGPVFYTKKGRGRQIKTYENLNGLKIGYSLHSVYFEPFNSDKTLHKIGISTEEQLIRMVALNRLDVTIGTNPNLAYDVNRFNLKDKVEQCDYVPEQKTNLYIGLSRKKHDKVLQGRIDAFIRRMLESGEMNKIMSAYR